MSTEIGALDISVTLPPGTVREGETFVLTWSVLPMSANDMKALEFGGFKVKDGFRTTVEFDIAAGTVQPCEPISAASP